MATLELTSTWLLIMEKEETIEPEPKASAKVDGRLGLSRSDNGVLLRSGG